MAERCPAHHNAVHAVTVEILFGFLGGIDVAVADDGNGHTGIVLHLPYEGPVGLALVHLLTGAAVDGQGLDACILQAFGQLDYDLGVLVPAQAGLDRHRFGHGLHDHPGYHHHLVRLPHHPGAGPAARYFVDRAAEVDVNHVAAVASGYLCRVVGHPGRLHHRLGNVSVYLDGHRSLLRDGLHLSLRLDGIPDKSVGRDELGIHHRRPLLAAEDAEGRVRHILHRREQHRPFSQIYIPYSHMLCFTPQR